MKKTIEVEINDLEYDNGYGGVAATLICNVEVEKLPSTHITTVKDGTWFLVDQDGGEIGERPYECGSQDQYLQEIALEEFMR